MSEIYEANGKRYTLDDLKEIWGKMNFVCYNDKDFYEWLEKQTFYKKVNE